MLRKTIVRRACFVILVNLMLIGGAAQAQGSLPPSPDYRGEIRRGPDGRLVAVPEPPVIETEPAEQSQAPATPKAAILVVGPGERITTITEAARLARDGEVIEIKAGTYRGQPVVWTQNRLTIRGVGGHPVMLADGQSAEGKALWVVRGGDVRIERVEFRGTRVADGNGAGIRFEKWGIRMSAVV